MKKFVIQVVILLIVIFGALLATKSNPSSLIPVIPQPVRNSQVSIKGVVIDVELADTPEKRRKGLGGRESLASNSGMLFVFDELSIYSFWMKGLTFPLDFIWIREGMVVDLHKNVPLVNPSSKDQEIPVYQPNQPVNMVLEVNAGFIDSHNVSIGDKIEMR